MTAVIAETGPGRTVAPAARPEKRGLRARLARWAGHRWLQWTLVLGIAACLAYDRALLCRQYLFRYTDEDQTCMWYAAHDLLNGHIGEPSFYGQDYGSCLEGFLAAPLVAMHVPYNIACPLVTVVLGLLPFLLIALVAWRRGQSLVSAATLLIPLLMPVRYGMICGIPRSFVTGIAVAGVSAILLLPAAPHRGGIARPNGLRRSWPALRYFLAAALSVAAFQLNPGCAILLAPVAVYAVLTSWREWRFWVCGLAGLIAAAPYPLYVYRFYYVVHPDYVEHFRGATWHWSYSIFNSYLPRFIAPTGAPSPVLRDLVPLPVSGIGAPAFTVAAFGAVGMLLLLRCRIAALCAAFVAVFTTLLSFGYDRLQIGGNTASYAYARMFLAIPVVFAWLLFMVNHTPWRPLADSTAGRWATRGMLAGLLLAGLRVAGIKQAQLPDEIAREVNARGAVVCPAMPVEQIYATAREVERTAKASHADLLIIGGSSDRRINDYQKDFAYALPALIDIETIYRAEERRTWRLIDERAARHEAILFIALNIPGAERVGGGNTVWFDEHGNQVPAPANSAAAATQHLHPYTIPVITMVKANGRSAYQIPELAGRLPAVYTPYSTPSNPHPEPQVVR